MLGGFSAVFLQLWDERIPQCDLKKNFGGLRGLLGTSSERKTNVQHWHQQGKLQFLQEVRICRLYFTNIIYSLENLKATTGSFCWCFPQPWNYVTESFRRPSLTCNLVLLFYNIYWLRTRTIFLPTDTHSYLVTIHYNFSAAEISLSDFCVKTWDLSERLFTRIDMFRAACYL